MYPVYHEMDFSNLYEYFKELEQKKTILRLLCERYNSSLPKISESTGISLSTLSKYNEDDKHLYKGSFQYIFRIAEFFNVPITLFLS
jgi:transcriptional regulator with XRE-family HTH domain